MRTFSCLRQLGFVLLLLLLVHSLYINRDMLVTSPVTEIQRRGHHGHAGRRGLAHGHHGHHGAKERRGNYTRKRRGRGNRMDVPGGPRAVAKGGSESSITQDSVVHTHVADVNITSVLRESLRSRSARNRSRVKKAAKEILIMNSGALGKAIHLSAQRGGGVSVGDVQESGKSGAGMVKYRHRLPNVMIIGASKAGANPLNMFLSLHPNITTISGELNFFTQNYRRGIQWYMDALPLVTEDQILVENSPSYAAQAPAVLQRFKVFGLPRKMKFIFIVRNPIERVISHYKALRRTRKVSNTFEFSVKKGGKYLDKNSNLLKGGMYYDMLTKWTKVYSLLQIHVVDGEEFRKEPIKSLEGIELFLGIPHLLKHCGIHYNKDRGEYCYFRDSISHCHMAGGRNASVNAPVMISKGLFRELEEFYRPHNAKLYKYLGKRFSW